MADRTVRTLVHRPAVDVTPETTLRTLASILGEESVGVVVVRAARSSDGLHAAGIVSERDIVRSIADGADPDTTRAEDIMTEDLAFAAPDESLRSVSLRMLDNEIRHLPVVASGRVIGVLSMRDLFDALVEADSTTPP